MLAVNLWVTITFLIPLEFQWVDIIAFRYIPDTYVLLKLLLSSFLAIYRKIEIAPAFLMYDLNGKNSTTS